MAAVFGYLFSIAIIILVVFWPDPDEVRQGARTRLLYGEHEEEHRLRVRSTAPRIHRTRDRADKAA